MRRRLATLDLPEDLHPKAVEAVRDFVKTCSEGWEGPFTVHFKDGIPQKRDRTESHRYGRAGGPPPLPRRAG